MKTLRTDIDLSFKCGSCLYAKLIQGSKKGIFGSMIECTNKEHLEKYCNKHISTKWKQRTHKACKKYKQMQKTN